MSELLGVSFAKKIFIEYCQNIPSNSVLKNIPINDGIVKSTNEFLACVNEANKIYNKAFAIPEIKQLIIVEDFPNDLANRINTQDYSDILNENSNARELRIVTYSVNEAPASLGAHRPDEKSFVNIKEKLIGYYEDPDYTGYHIVRFGREIEANIKFKVWGFNFYDIRERATSLKSMINKNIWYFKHKGLQEIYWISSNENEMWNGKNLIKMRTEEFVIRFVEIRDIKEKDIEQIVICANISN